MEKFVNIIHQAPLQEHTYQDRNQQPQVFASRGFILTDGIDTFYAEAVGDMARSLPEFDPSVLHTVQCQMSVKEFQDRNQETRYRTECRIVKIV